MDKSLEDIQSQKLLTNEANKKLQQTENKEELHKQSDQNKKDSSQLPREQEKQQKENITVKLFQQKINKAIQLKNSGNGFFKQKNYVDAIKQYSNALKLLDPTYFYGATEAQLHKMAELSSNLLCNLGYCYFNSHDMIRAQIFFGQAITINPKYIKALHKRALSRYELKKYEEAFQDIKFAFSLDKSNAEIHSAYSKILDKYNQQVKKNKEKMKQMSTKIFANDTQRSDSPTKKPSTLKGQQKKKEGMGTKESKESKSGWSWPQKLTFAGAAILIGTGIFQALRK